MKNRRILALLLAVILFILVCQVNVFAEEVTYWHIPSISVSCNNDGYVTVTFSKDTYSAFASYIEILYSTDQMNWKLAGKQTNLSWGSYSMYKPDQGYFMIDTVYYFTAHVVGSDDRCGPMAPIESITYKNSLGEEYTRFTVLEEGLKNYKVTEKSVNYDKIHLKKGMKISFDTPLYILTVKVLNVDDEKAKIRTLMKNKGPEGMFYVRSFSSVGKAKHFDMKNTTNTFYFKYGALDAGANYLDFEIAANISVYWNRNVKGLGSRSLESKLYRFSKSHRAFFQGPVITEPITFTKKDLKVTTTSISFGAAYKSYSKEVVKSGSILFYKSTNSEKWRKHFFKSGEVFSINNLKQNTEYEFKKKDFVESISAVDGKKHIKLTGNYSEVVKLRTSIANAPEIKSISVSSKVVNIHYPARSWYDGSAWIHEEAYDFPQTNFTITVYLKNTPKCMKALQCSGIGNSPIIVKGSGTVYSFSGSVLGNVKGQKASLRFLSYTNRLGADWYAGSSPSVKKSVTL